MMSALAMTGRFAALALVFTGVAALSDRPAHRSLPENVGVVTLSFSHGADRRAACRKATAEELADLPPNMRRPEICPRERPPIHVELDIDGSAAFRADVPPSGIAGDGPSRVHERFLLPAGTHTIDVRMQDRPGAGFSFQSSRTLEVPAAGHRVVDFRADTGGFIFH